MSDLYTDTREKLDYWDAQWLLFCAKAGLKLLIILAGAWAINFYGEWTGQGFLLIFFILSTFVVVPVLFMPSSVLAVTTISLLTGSISSGLRTYVQSVAPTILFWVHFTLGLLTTYPFHWGPWWAFWLAVGAGTMFATLTWKYFLKIGVLKPITLTYTTGIMVVALSAPFWGVTNNWWESQTHNEAFDPSNGEPLKMGYIDSTGTWVEDPLGRSPADCRPDTLPHEAFDYATRSECFSAKTGERLVPITREAAESAGFIPNLLPLTTPAQAEAARAAEEAERAAQIALVRAQNPAPVIVPPPPRTAASETACTGRYAGLQNCKRVVFGDNTEYVREAVEDHCLVADPHTAVTRTDLGGDNYLFLPNRGNAVVKFFDLPVGESFYSFTCR